ncbi:PaaI family thioesterase [Acaryochloris thomasi]|nr:YiiD C-terminal domain-containing protein [Acaryochloris thomasi]
MDITKVPFVKYTGIQYGTSGVLELEAREHLENHMGAVHASAQFALAETASGAHLQTLFPELVGKVIPLLRDAAIKFKAPATTSISAHVSAAEDSVASFQKQFQRKGRSSIEVTVDLIDSNNSVTCSCLFKWFIQRIESE